MRRVLSKGSADAFPVASSSALRKCRMEAFLRAGERAIRGGAEHVAFILCCAAAVCSAAASELGESALKAGDLRNAARFYREEAEKAEAGSESWRNASEQLFWIALREGELKEAKTLFDRLAKYEKPETARMRTLRTGMLFAEGEYTRAAEEAALPTVPAATPAEALKLFSWRYRALLALQRYDAAGKAASEFSDANPKAGPAGRMFVLFCAIMRGNAEKAQRLFAELEKMPEVNPDELKKLRFLQQVRDAKTPVEPGNDAPRPTGMDETLYTAYSLLADRAETAAKPEISVDALKSAAEAAPDHRARRNIRSRLLNLYLSTGKKQEAADCAELLLDDTKNDPAARGEALLRAARLRMESGRKDLAVRFYREAVNDRTLPSACRITAARECAAVHIRSKEYDKANALYLFIQENGSTEEERQEGNFLQGEMAYSRGDYRTAADFFRKSEQNPQWRNRSLFWLIQSRMQLNEFYPALDAAEALASVKEPDFAASGQFYRAVLLEKLGRKEEAAAAYSRFAAAFPKSAYTRNALLHAAALDKELKKYASALKSDMEFAARFPGDDEAPAALCRAYEDAFFAGNRPAMEEILKLMMTRYPGSPCTAAVVFGEIDFLRAGQRNDEALALLMKLSAQQPVQKAEQSAQILYEKARLLDSLGRQTQALKELQTLQTNYPNTLRGADALMLSGSIRSDRGEYEQAAEDYRRAAALRPGGIFSEVCEGRVADCLYSRASLKYDEKLLAGAMEIFRRLSSSRDFRIAAQSLYKYGRCLELADRDDEALTVYNDMLYAAVNARKKSGPWSPEWISRAVYAGCMIYLDDGSASAAREAVRMLRLFRSLGVDTGEDFTGIEKKLRDNYRI